jgi:hypothetical protein
VRLWGYWNVGIDPAAGRVDIIPLRGAEFTCNVTMFLQPPAGKIANLKIKITDLTQFFDQGKIDVEVTLVHPFPGLDMYTGFDVLGVFVHDGDTIGKYDSTIMYARGADVGKLLNADGYTRWYNPGEFPESGLLGFTEGALGNKAVGFSATINPYKCFADGLDADADLTDFLHQAGVIDGRCAFRSTSSNTRLYKLQFPMGGSEPYLIFQYAVVASWEPPVPTPPVNIPGDFPLNANMREPFQLSVIDNGSELWYTGGVGGGTLRMKAELFDWQASTNPSGILGEFSRIVIESPNADIPGGYAEFTPADFAPFIQPSTAISSVAEIEFEGVAATGPNNVEFLVTVVSKDGDTFDQGFGVPVPSSPLASYFRFEVPVVTSPCGNFNVTGAVPPSVASGSSYTGVTVHGESFVDGSNLAIDIMDGTTIVAHGTSIAYVDSGELTCDFDLCGVVPGDFQLRVTNGCDPISYGSIPYAIDPDPLKNISLHGGVQIADLGICGMSHESYVQFTDGQLWIYDQDYSTGEYKITNVGLDRVAPLDPAAGQTGGEASMGSTTNASAGQYIYQRDSNSMWVAGYAGLMLDVFVIYDNTRHYYMQDEGTSLLCTRRTSIAHGGNLTSYSYVGTGPGYVNVAAVKGIGSVGDLPENLSAWYYVLEGAPEFSVERINYDSVAPGAHNLNKDQTFFGTQGDGHNQLNDPKDIAGDLDYHVFILDVYSTGQPVVKVYNSDLGYIGEFGDNWSISGTPLRLDVDDVSGYVHVAHTNGVSVFRPCEIPL